MVKRAKKIVTTSNTTFGKNDAARRTYIRQLKYEKLLGKVVAKGDEIVLEGGDAKYILDTDPLGDTQITEDTDIVLEEPPYFEWTTKNGVHHGEFLASVPWIKQLKKDYNIE
jgi:hypothetical protein